MHAILLALISAALFGAATPASKALLHTFPPFQLAGLLYLGAALGVAPVALRGKGVRLPWRAGRKSVLRLAGAIGFGGILAPVFLLLGLHLASAASVSLWLNLELVATAVLGYLIFHDHIGQQGWVGVLGIMLAGGILSLGEEAAGVRAGLLVALACLCWGLDNHLTALIDGISPAQSTLWKGLVAGTVNLTIGTAAQPYAGSLLTTGVGVAVGAFSYGVSIAFYITAAQSLGATRVQMLFASAPFFGAVLSAGALGESISRPQAAAASMLALGLLLMFRDRHGHKHAHEAIEHEHAHGHNDEHHAHVHPGNPVFLRHLHWHEHEAVSHSHPHWPDLHHRHRHTQVKHEPRPEIFL